MQGSGESEDKVSVVAGLTFPWHGCFDAWHRNLKLLAYLYLWHGVNVMHLAY